MGSKNRIAKELITEIIWNEPNAQIFIDLFAGGCAISHSAILSGSFKKVIALDGNVLYCMVVNNESILRDIYYLWDTKCWKKITSKQFKDIYLAVLKDIQDPNLDDKESNWLTVYKSIMNSINKEV